MKRPAIAVVAACVAVLFVVLLATGFRNDPSAISSPLIRKPAAGFSLRTMNGDRTVSLAEFRGRPVVLNFSASWCVDCRVDQQYLSAAFQEYKAQHVAFISVLYEDSASGMSAFIRRYGGGWPVLRDPDQQTAISYGVYGVPETFFIDRKGVVRYKAIGPVPWDRLNTEVRSLISSQA